MRLAGRTVLITGAAGGIGQAIARALAARGASLLLSGRRAEVLAALAQELGGRVLPCDLAEPGAPERLAAQAADADVLVANAALPASGPLTAFALAEIERALAVNLHAPIVLARVLGEGMTARGAGHLVFMSSLAGKSASGGAALYSATKFGLRGLALGLREDLRPHGVGVSTVFPGFIREAGMFAESGAVLPRGIGTRSPQEVAAAVVRAVEENRAEVDVAPFGLRAGAALAGLAPEIAAGVQRRLGGTRLSAAIAAGQRAKR